MVWFLTGVMLLGAGLLALRWLATAEPRAVRKALVGVAALVLAVLALGLLFTGQFIAAIPLAMAALAAYQRYRNARRWWRWASTAGGAAAGDGGAGAQRASEVNTDWLSMTLDHATGALDGTVRQGAYAGRALGSMSLDELLDLFGQLQAADAEGARLLEAYLDRAHGADWRDRAGTHGGAGSGGGDDAAGFDSAMTRDEAYRILGLEPGADAAAVREAHRRLMLKLHPDQGGSTYLASKINQAKDLLMGD